MNTEDKKVMDGSQSLTAGEAPLTAPKWLRSDMEADYLIDSLEMMGEILGRTLPSDPSYARRKEKYEVRRERVQNLLGLALSQIRGGEA